MQFIEVKDLTVEFTRIAEDGTEVKGNRAIDGISFSVEKGSFVAVVAPRPKKPKPHPQMKPLLQQKQNN